MVNARSMRTGEVPLKLAATLSKFVNAAWVDGSFIQNVTPITKDLLQFWDPKGNFSDRKFNFNEGQWQAILNTIYVHEILKVKNVKDLYKNTDSELLAELDILELNKEKYSYPKYFIKMATGTGKTWVLNALLIWQYLNAEYEENASGRYSKNFLLLAPGIIVYERLLDAYLGKVKEDETRDFNESDFKKFEDVFLPSIYRDEVFGFIQSAVAQKEEIGKKITGEGVIAITNWHILMINKFGGEAPEDIVSVIKEILPITPGTSSGHSLNELDAQYSSGAELEFLKNLPNLVIFNDEAHHLGEWKKSDEILEKKWQESLDGIAKNKKDGLLEVEFSATPYGVTGSGQRRIKDYFPHIIVNFELVEAIRQGLVKTVAIDRRKEIAAIPLEFKAEKEMGVVTNLSEGQRIMLRAGITKLKILEDGFSKLDKTKRPKMLVICENTNVAPLVINFLKQEGYSEEELLEIHSKREELSEDDWNSIKQRLFSIDKYDKPKIIVSVLMLREGFDVNNICVIVPLRSSSSAILLEQTIGRGLRLMWREPEFQESKRENRERLLIKKEEPTNWMDILSIIEHPAFIEFYEKELAGAIGEVNELPRKERVVGDFIVVKLKDNYTDYDIFWPIIVNENEEELTEKELSIENLEQSPIKLDELKSLVNKEGDTFQSEELTVHTKFGEYQVTSEIFTVKSYNSFLQKIVNIATTIPVKIGKKNQKIFPLIQINSAAIAEFIDNYIRHKLFNKNFDPLIDNNWKVLILTQGRIVQHIVKNIANAIYNLQKDLKISEAEVIKRYFSENKEIRLRENYSLDVAKSIYPKIGYPSNKGGFEKAFIEFIDSDSKVNSFMKINQYLNEFANIIYIRDDGLLALYYPDFLVKIAGKMYLVETKAEKDLNQQNVINKRLAAAEWVNRVNQLKENDRMNCTWSYVLLGEETFYSMSKNGATTEEILEYAKMTIPKIKGELRDYL